MSADATSFGDVLGRTVGHFRLDSRLGAGGMGTVYRATDLTLGRSVALKLLPADLMAGANVRSRFLREARTAAAVTHPHIAAVYEIGDDGDHVYIAMELVEGRSLGDLLDEHSVQDASAVVHLALQLLDALDTAHRAGIVHRDIKPDNVMIDHRGNAKLLDFGVAKALFCDVSDMSPADGVATIDSFQTHEGVIVGTPAYMAPEQVTGQAIDARADLFALGVLIYEMLSGESPFSRDTPMDSVIAVTKDDAPSLALLRPDLPETLVAIVERCLQREPAARWPDAQAMMDALQATGIGEGGAAALPTVIRSSVPSELPTGTEPTVEAPAPARPQLTRPRATAGTLVLAAIAAIGAFMLMRSPPERVEPTIDGPRSLLRIIERRLTANPSDNWVVSAHLVDDGRALVYQDSDGVYELTLDGSEPVRIAFPEGAPPRVYDVSATGRHFLLGDVGQPVAIQHYDLETDRLKVAAPATGVAVLSPNGRSVAYAVDGRLRVVALDDGRDHALAELEEEDSIAQLSWSPKGDRLTYVRRRSGGGEMSGSLEVVAADGGSEPRVIREDARLVLRGGMTAVSFWAPTVLLYVLASSPGAAHGAELWEQRLDAEGRAEGDARQIHTWAEGTPVETKRGGDGLVYLRMVAQSDVWAATLRHGATSLRRVRQVTRDQRHDAPNSFQGRGDLLFMSTRSGAWGVFRSSGGLEERVGGGQTWDTFPVPHEDAVLFFRLQVEESGRIGRSELVRREADGTLRPLFDVQTEAEATASGRPPPTVTAFRCVGDTCLISEPEDGELVFRRFDPQTGVREEDGCRLESSENLYQWDLSPDATTIVYVASGSDVTFVALATCEERTLAVADEGSLGFVTYTPDGGRIVLTGVHLLGQRYVLLSLDVGGGEPSVLYTSDSVLFGHPTISPDGRTLMFSAEEFDIDAWMLEGLADLD